MLFFSYLSMFLLFALRRATMPSLARASKENGSIPYTIQRRDKKQNKKKKIKHPFTMINASRNNSLFVMKFYSDPLNTCRRGVDSPNAEVQIRFTVAQIQVTRGSHVSILGCSLCTYRVKFQAIKL